MQKVQDGLNTKCKSLDAGNTIPQAHDAENNAANRCCNKSILEQTVQRHATCKSTNIYLLYAGNKATDGGVC